MEHNSIHFVNASAPHVRRRDLARDELDLRRVGSDGRRSAHFVPHSVLGVGHRSETRWNLRRDARPGGAWVKPCSRVERCRSSRAVPHSALGAGYPIATHSIATHSIARRDARPGGA